MRIVILIFIILLIVIVASCITVVPQAKAVIVERLGGYLECRCSF